MYNILNMKLKSVPQSIYRIKHSILLILILTLLINQLFERESTLPFEQSSKECDCADASNKSQEHEFLDLPISALELNYMEENLQFMDQSDPRLIQYTRIRYLTPPSKLPYVLKGNRNFLQNDKVVAEVFRNKRNGIFIEAGAYDGLELSHSLELEANLGWTGLLIECNPTLIPRLKSRNRKAWIASVCLASGTKPGTLTFSYPPNWSYSGTVGKKWDKWDFMGKGKNPKWVDLNVETLPLFTVLAAVGLTEVDYFCFDIEGVELAVLRDFPFDKIIFKLLIIEILYYDNEQKKELNDLLVTNNYHFVSDYEEIDKVYVHNSFKDELNLEPFHGRS